MEEVKRYKESLKQSEAMKTYIGAYSAFTSYCTLSDEALDWLFKSWKETDPFEKKICLLRYYQKRKQANEFVSQMQAYYTNA